MLNSGRHSGGRKRNVDDVSSTCFPDGSKGDLRSPQKKMRCGNGGGHRQLSEVWDLISDGSVPAVHQAAILICRFCGSEVHTSYKSSRAIAHLQKKCVPGKAYLDSIPPEERTQFIADEFYGGEGGPCPVVPHSSSVKNQEVWRWLCVSGDSCSGSSSEDSHLLPPQHSKMARCQHCGKAFTCHAKAENAIRHLKRCQRARAFFDSLPNHEHTKFTMKHFFRPGRQDEGLQTPQAQPAVVVSDTEAVTLISNHQDATPSISNQQRFLELLSLFFFSSGTALHLVDNPYLQEALRILVAGNSHSLPADSEGGQALAVPGSGQIGQLLHSMHAKLSVLVAAEEKRRKCCHNKKCAEDEDEEEAWQDQGEHAVALKLDFIRRHHSLLGASLGVPARAHDVQE